VLFHNTFAGAVSELSKNFSALFQRGFSSMDEFFFFARHFYPSLMLESFLLFCTNILFFIIVLLLLGEIRKLKRAIKNQPGPRPPNSKTNQPPDDLNHDDPSKQNHV